MEFIKILHVSCALLSISGFIARGVLMIKASPWLEARFVKTAPHFVDTLLLASGIILASQWGWAVLQQPWLVAKVIALLAYIGLGMLALHGERDKAGRIISWLLAILLFAYILAVALSKNPVVF